LASEKQIKANRRNALVSTGPRTIEGKLRSRFNALSHGMTAATVVLPTEDAAEYEQLQAEMRGVYQPANAAEQQLVDMLTAYYWRLQRAIGVETAIFALGLRSSARAQIYANIGSLPFKNADIKLDPMDPGIALLSRERSLDDLNKFGRHEAHLVRQIRQVQEMLATLQKTRVTIDAKSKAG
jgi:hypothetical protein